MCYSLHDKNCRSLGPQAFFLYGSLNSVISEKPVLQFYLKATLHEMVSLAGVFCLV